MMVLTKGGMRNMSTMRRYLADLEPLDPILTEHIHFRFDIFNDPDYFY